MKWRKFKSLDSLELGDLVYVKSGSARGKIAFVNHTAICSIPSSWTVDKQHIADDGSLVNSHGQKLGQIKRILKIKSPISKKP